ncbi:hypothetical protein RF55_9456 [Lasius niger]|uniref:Uncharacterized protein n=1 Tax=Lasius niger TaxID=67767 RepID=A0A0J7KKJ7_LASNI|nr:hypothetical protein RF55_9456 [Lasius niger]
MCLRLLQNIQETKIIRSKPGHVWRWNAITEEFEQLEVLKWNNTAFCSVNAINDMRGKTLVVAMDFVSIRISDDPLLLVIIVVFP